MLVQFEFDISLIDYVPSEHNIAFAQSCTAESRILSSVLFNRNSKKILINILIIWNSIVKNI